MKPKCSTGLYCWIVPLSNNAYLILCPNPGKPKPWPKHHQPRSSNPQHRKVWTLTHSQGTLHSSVSIYLYNSVSIYIYTTHTQLLSCGYMLILLYSIYWNNNAGKLFKTTKQQWCSVTKNIALKMNQTKLGERDGLWHWLYDITNNIRSGKLT